MTALVKDFISTGSFASFTIYLWETFIFISFLLLFWEMGSCFDLDFLISMGIVM